MQPRRQPREEEQSDGGKRLKYGEMRPYVDENNVGDYRFDGNQALYYADFDIQDIWYQKAAPSQSHNVSVQGSSGRTTFYTSFNYDSKEDIMKFNPGLRKPCHISDGVELQEVLKHEAGCKHCREERWV